MIQLSGIDEVKLSSPGQRWQSRSASVATATPVKAYNLNTSVIRLAYLPFSVSIHQTRSQPVSQICTYLVAVEAWKNVNQDWRPFSRRRCELLVIYQVITSLKVVTMSQDRHMLPR